MRHTDHARAPATVWHGGDECADTGETVALHGATWRALRRLSDGREVLRMCDADKARDDARRLANDAATRAGFARLHR